MGAAAVLCAAASTLSLVNLRHLRRPVVRDTGARISVLVPARDEADRIGPTLASLRALTGVAQILVLDDHSSDDTAGLVQAAGLQVIRSTDEPPAGWLGKPWACQRLAEAATGDILVFIDADVELAPDAARAAASLLHELDLVCPYPRQVTTGVLQRLVQPLLQWSWLTFLPLAVAERSSHPALSAGNGQFVAVRRDAYFAAGGHAAVRGQVLEDLALVRRFKATGHRVAMADGTQIATCRMYSGQRDLIAGYTKSLHDAFGVPTVALLGLMYVLPVAGRSVPTPPPGGVHWVPTLPRWPDARRLLPEHGSRSWTSGPTRCRSWPSGSSTDGRWWPPGAAPSRGEGVRCPGVTEQHRLPGDRGPVARAVLPVPPLLGMLDETRAGHGCGQQPPQIAFECRPVRLQRIGGGLRDECVEAGSQGQWVPVPGEREVDRAAAGMRRAPARIGIGVSHKTGGKAAVLIHAVMQNGLQPRVAPGVKHGQPERRG